MTSKTTVRNQMPAVYNTVLVKFGWEYGSINLDMGSGPYGRLSKRLNEVHSITTYEYDPLWFDKDHNDKALNSVLRKGGADTITLSNVLNVIPKKSDRKELMHLACLATKSTTRIYVHIYEGKGDNKCRKTKFGHQMNRKTYNYIREIRDMGFEKVVQYGQNLIVVMRYAKYWPLDLPKHKAYLG